MKKVFFGIAVAILTSITVAIISCKKEKAYSCNEEANNYALINLNTNQSISRDSLAKLPYEFQFAVFESLTPENKHRIFKEKVDYIISHNTLSTQEIAALQELKDLDPGTVYNHSEEEPLAVITQWEQKVKTNLGWTDQIIFEHVGTWLTTAEMQTMAAVYSPAEAGNSCTCASNWACIWSGSNCNYRAGCNVTQTGCGIIGGAKCRGNCGNAPVSGSGGSSSGISN